MGDLTETLTNVGETMKAGVRGLKNLSAPPGPGQGAPALGQTPSGPVRYSKDGSPPTPVNPDGSAKNVDNSGLTKERFP
jgi:hypothetical protein